METDTSQETHNRKRRFGKVLFILGALLELTLIILGGLVEVVSALTSNQYIKIAYSINLPFLVVLGGFMIIVGFITWIIGDVSDDALLITQLGPFR